MASLAEQATASRDTVLVVPATDRSAILVTGKDRTSWLNGLVTADLAKLAPGQASYALLVEKKGRIQTDLAIAPREDALALAVPTDLRDAITTTLDHYLVMEDAELSRPDLGFFFAHGPKAKDLVGVTPYGGTLDLLGRGGAVLAAPNGDALAAKVAALGGLMGDDDAWNALRIEHGLPRFGAEVDSSLYPQEAALEKLAVSFDKGCYLGQEVVYMLENRGHVKRKLVGLDLDSLVAVGAPVSTLEGEAVGEVKSAAMGPLSNRAVAIAMVKWAQSRPGTELRAAGTKAVVRA